LSLVSFVNFIVRIINVFTAFNISSDVFI